MYICVEITLRCLCRGNVYARLNVDLRKQYSSDEPHLGRDECESFQ